MDFYGAIRAKPGGQPLTYDAWCAYVAHRKDLIRSGPRTGKNPKTGQPMVIRPRPDGARVVANGQVIGSVGWSQTGGDFIVVGGKPEVIVPWARAVAAELDAEFVELPTD